MTQNEENSVKIIQDFLHSSLQTVKDKEYVAEIFVTTFQHQSSNRSKKFYVDNINTDEHNLLYSVLKVEDETTYVKCMVNSEDGTYELFSIYPSEEFFCKMKIGKLVNNKTCTSILIRTKINNNFDGKLIEIKIIK